MQILHEQVGLAVFEVGFGAPLNFVAHPRISLFQVHGLLRVEDIGEARRRALGLERPEHLPRLGLRRREQLHQFLILRRAQPEVADGALALRSAEAQLHRERGVRFDRDGIGGQEQRRVRVGQAVGIGLPAGFGFGVDSERDFIAGFCGVSESLRELDLCRFGVGARINNLRLEFRQSKVSVVRTRRTFQRQRLVRQRFQPHRRETAGREFHFHLVAVRGRIRAPGEHRAVLIDRKFRSVRGLHQFRIQRRPALAQLTAPLRFPLRLGCIEFWHRRVEFLPPPGEQRLEFTLPARLLRRRHFD